MKRRDLLQGSALGLAALQRAIRAQGALDSNLTIGNSVIRITVPAANYTAWSLTDIAGAKTYEFAPPVFPVNGNPRLGIVTRAAASAPRLLPNGVTEYRFHSALKDDPSLSLGMAFRIAPDRPVVRFRYELSSATGQHRLRGPAELRYFGVRLGGMARVH